MNILELSEQEIVRRQCLQELRDMGIDPYPAAEYPVNAFQTKSRKISMRTKSAMSPLRGV